MSGLKHLQESQKFKPPLRIWDQTTKMNQILQIATPPTENLADTLIPEKRKISLEGITSSSRPSTLQRNF